MRPSDFRMSEHNDAFPTTFQGDGWALTCSPTLHKELSAMLDGAASAEQKERKAPEPKFTAEKTDSARTHYKPDWADKVFARSINWYAEESNVPLWLQKATEDADFALFQLPTPDRRWVVKFGGVILEPFDYRLPGWSELHEIMVHGFLLDRTELIVADTSIAELRKLQGDLLRNAELVRTKYGPSNQKIPDIHCTLTGTRPHVSGVRTPDGVESDRWKSCADDFHKQLRDRLDRVFKAIKRKNIGVGRAIKQAVRFRDAQWSFSHPAKWMTALGEIPYDATMILTGENWEITFPESNDLLIVPDSVGMRAVARVLMCGNVPCPCALLADGELLNAFLGRPRHHKYFDATYRKPKVVSGDRANNEVEQAICAAMCLKEEWHYKADHTITDTSELHTVCGLPTSRITLKYAAALEGIRDVLMKQQSRLFFTNPPSHQFKTILADIEAGVEFARKQENLLVQVQPKSEEYQAKIQKAIARLKDGLWSTGDWMTRCDRLADHFAEHIRGGIVFQYTGPYRWKIEGIAQTPDSLDLADDHIAYKWIKARKAARRARAAAQAIRVLNGVSKGAAC